MLPWSEIDTVMFDMDGTLLDLHFDNFFWQDYVPAVYSQTHGGDAEAALAKLHARYLEVKGSLSWYSLDFWSTELNLDIGELKRTVRNRISIRPGVEEMLTLLQATDKQLLLVTNADPTALQIKIEETGIDRFFNHSISSHELDLAKENQGFWRRLQEKIHYQPDRTVLFDDSLPVLLQAQAEGIRHLYGIHQPDSMKQPLADFAFPRIVDFAHIHPDSDL